VNEAADGMHRLATVGIDMDDVGLTLGARGVVSFHGSLQLMLAALDAKPDHQAGR
jgi:transaldolase